MSAKGFDSQRFNPAVMRLYASAPMESLVMFICCNDLWFSIKMNLKREDMSWLMSVSVSSLLLAAVKGKVWISFFSIQFFTSCVWREESMPKASYKCRSMNGQLLSQRGWGDFWPSRQEHFYNQVYRPDVNKDFRVFERALLFRWSRYWPQCTFLRPCF